MAQITRETIIADILQIAPGSVPMFQAMGMHCLGCAKARIETLEEACASHGVDVDDFAEKLNALVTAQ